MTVYHDGAAMTSYVTDAILILTRTPEYYQMLITPLLLSMQLKGSDCSVGGVID